MGAGDAVQRRLSLVVNPRAGGGRAGRLQPRVETALAAAGHDVRAARTRSLAHAEQLATDALDDERVVVTLGGDGLAGRVAGTVAAAGGLLAVLPGGRGNDFCRATGIPLDAARACRLLTHAGERAVDMGVVDSDCGRVPFLGIASVGFDSAVQELALRTRLPLGRFVYLYGALAAVAGWQHVRFTLELDGAQHTLTGWTVAAANGGVYGGGMRLAPGARLDDGLLEVVTVAATSRVRFLRSLPGVFRGTHVRRPSVRTRAATTLTIRADGPWRVFADGDPAGRLPCTVQALPGALRVLLP